MSEKPAICPFNKRHVMCESALQKHIIKCMVNYPNYLVCPFNALHRFADQELLTKHLLVCKSNNELQCLFDHAKYSKLSSDIPYHMDNAREYNLAYEDWDKEIESTKTSN